MLSASVFVFALFKTIQLPRSVMHDEKRGITNSSRSHRRPGSRRRRSHRRKQIRSTELVSVSTYCGYNAMQEWLITGGYLFFVGILCRMSL